MAGAVERAAGHWPEAVDVAIVGGGFAGAATAWALARRGVERVAVLERESDLGVHASGRNAAMARQLCESDAVTERAVRGTAFLRHPPSGFSQQALLRRTGSILSIGSPALRDELAGRAARFGVVTEWISAAQVRQRRPELADGAAIGGFYVPGDGVIDVHELLISFVRGARASGHAVLTATEVRAIDGDRAGARIRTSRGTMRARFVVNAAGAWAGDVGAMARSERPLAAMRRHLFILEARDPAADAPFLWHLGEDEFYLRPEGSGILVSACDEEVSAPCLPPVAPEAAGVLAARMSRVAPPLVERGIVRAWACLRTFTEDRQPHLGWDEGREWLYWVVGLGGHGATCSSAIGLDAAAAIAERL